MEGYPLKLAQVKNYYLRKTKRALASQPLCKFHRYGHCKFGSLCRHFHTQDTCFTEDCDKLSCTSRHPRLCLYLSGFGHCKFGTACSYLHISHPLETSDNNAEIKKLKDSLQDVLTAFKEKEIQLKKVARELARNGLS